MNNSSSLATKVYTEQGDQGVEGGDEENGNIINNNNNLNSGGSSGKSGSNSRHASTSSKIELFETASSHPQSQEREEQAY